MSFFGWGKSESPKKPPPRTRRTDARRKNLNASNETKKPAKKKESSLTDEQILQNIDSKFFCNPNEGKFDPLAELLENVSTNDISPDDLQKMIVERESQLQVINSKLSEQVVTNYDRFVQGMVQIRELGVDLESTVLLCKTGRGTLHKADKELISSPVKIIANNRKRILYQRVADYLMTIKAIHSTESKLKNRLTDGDYPAAIELCQKFEKDVEANQQFTCIQAITKDVKRLENLVQLKLDASLLEVTRSFVEHSYERLLRAYRMSGKVHRVTHKLQQNFSDSVIAGTQDLLYAHVLISEDNAGKAEVLKKYPFAKLSEKLAEENFMPCLRAIFEYLVELMHSHYLMREWHLRIEEEKKEDEEDLVAFQDIRLGLERFSKDIWEQMQKNVALLLVNSNLVHFKIEPFISVLDAVSKLIDFGKEFSQSSANQLETCILQQSRNYFRQYHRKKLEDLKTMVENEHWEAMPVKPGYSPEDIKEIRHFVNPSEDTGISSYGNHNSTILKRNISMQGVSALASLSSTGNPFSEKRTNTYDQESDDEDEELKQDYVVEEGVDEQHHVIQTKDEPEIGTGASVTIVCVNLVKYIGNYLQMMEILQPIAYEVFQGVSELYQYYLYIVFYFFSTKPPSAIQTGISIMNQTANSFNSLFQKKIIAETEITTPTSFIDDIEDNHLKKSFETIHKTFFSEPTTEKTKETSYNLQRPTISSEIDIQSTNSMYGLKPRTVALESMEFLSNCMLSVKEQLLQLLPANYSDLCNQFYKNYVDIVPRVRDVIMESISQRFVNVSQVPQQIEKVKWNINALDTNHNSYIDDLIAEFKMLSVKLQQVVLQDIVSRPEKEFLFKKCISLAMEQLVEGYSRIKRCSLQGRTLMSLDLQVFATELKRIAPHLNPVPSKNHVEMYIKAYFSENILEWITNHQDEYTGKQLLGLANCAANNLNRKDSKELFRAVDEICAKKKN